MNRLSTKLLFHAHKVRILWFVLQMCEKTNGWIQKLKTTFKCNFQSSFFTFLHLSVNAFISLPGKQSSCTCCPHCTQTLCVFIFVELFKGTFKRICQLKHRYFLFCSASYMLKCIAAHGIYTKNVFCCGPLYPPSRAINVCVMYNWYVFASCRNRIVVDVTVLNI